MTNREALESAISRLSDEDFVFVLMSRQSRLPEMVDNYVCEICTSRHGKCAAISDHKCPLSIREWLAEECPEGGVLSFNINDRE